MKNVVLSCICRISLLLVAAVFLPLMQAHASDAEVPSSKPNIVLILLDDVGRDVIGAYGKNNLAITPNIDRLARKGLLLNAYYANHPYCSPTRAALVTGKYPERVGIVTNREYQTFGLSFEEVTMAEQLQSHGYKTALIGKWHLGRDEQLQDYGFDEYITHRKDMKNIEQLTDVKRSFDAEGRAEFAADFIRAHRNEPFFLYLSVFEGHHPWEGRERFLSRIPQEQPEDMIFAEEDAFFAKEEWSHTEYWSYLRHYIAEVALADEAIGTVVRVLENENLLENTLIIVSADNGSPFLQRTVAGRKGSVEEGGILVPGVVHWPAVIEGGRVSDGIITLMDLYPTFVELAGGRPDEVDTDGKSLMPLFRGEADKIHEIVYFSQVKARDDYFVAVRQDEWKYVRWKKLLSKSNAEREWLFNLSDNPQDALEKNNMSMLKENAELAEKFRALADGHVRYVQANMSENLPAGFFDCWFHPEN